MSSKIIRNWDQQMKNSQFVIKITISNVLLENYFKPYCNRNQNLKFKFKIKPFLFRQTEKQNVEKFALNRFVGLTYKISVDSGIFRDKTMDDKLIYNPTVEQN